MDDPDLTKYSRRAELAGDRHHDDVGPGGVVFAVADYDGGALLRGGLAGERERHQDDIAEAKEHRRRRRPDCSMPSRKRLRSRLRRLAKACDPARATG